MFNPDPAVGFIAHAWRFSSAIAAGQVLAPAHSLGEMSRLVFNDYVDATLAALFVAVVVADGGLWLLQHPQGTGDAEGDRRGSGVRRRRCGRTQCLTCCRIKFAEWKERGQAVKIWSVRAARLMVGVPDYDTYVEHRRANHPGLPIMTYEEFFVERQEARYAVGKGRFKGCC